MAQSAVGSLRALGELTVEVHDAYLVLAIVANEAGNGHELCAHHATGYGSVYCLVDEEGSVSGVGICKENPHFFHSKRIIFKKNKALGHSHCAVGQSVAPPHVW